MRRIFEEFQMIKTGPTSIIWLFGAIQKLRVKIGGES